MKALKYKILIYEGTMDFIHHAGNIIEEIFIPDENIVFNTQAVFKSGKHRGEGEIRIEIEIDDKFVNILKKYLKYKDKIEEERKKYFISIK